MFDVVLWVVCAFSNCGPLSFSPFNSNEAQNSLNSNAPAVIYDEKRANEDPMVRFYSEQIEKGRREEERAERSYWRRPRTTGTTY